MNLPATHGGEVLLAPGSTIPAVEEAKTFVQLLEYLELPSTRHHFQIEKSSG